MAFKFIVFAACLAAANAGYLGAPAAVGYAAAPAYGYASGYAAPNAYSAGYQAPSVASIGQNTYRSYGNLGQVSTYSKALDTPYSSVRKTDVRVSNDALAYGAAPVSSYGYAAPALTSYAAAPAITSYAAAPAISSYAAAPALSYGAYASPAYASPAYATRAYAPAIAKVASPAALGVAYSAAPLVAHMSFNGYGVNYAY